MPVSVTSAIVMTGPTSTSRTNIPRNFPPIGSRRTWFTARASGYFSDRRYDTYNYNLFVSSMQFPAVPGFAPTTSAGWFYAPAYQQFMFDNRDRTKANIAFDIVAFRGVTISPTFKFQDDYYGLNPANQEGISNSRSTSWGVDVGYVVNPDLSFTVSYYWEDYNQLLYNYTSTFTGTALPPRPAPARRRSPRPTQPPTV